MDIIKRKSIIFYVIFIMIKRKSCPFRLSVSKGLIVEKKRIAFLYEKRNHINRALLGTKFDYTEAETTLLFFLKFILSKS